MKDSNIPLQIQSQYTHALKLFNKMVSEQSPQAMSQSVEAWNQFLERAETSHFPKVHTEALTHLGLTLLHKYDLQRQLSDLNEACRALQEAARFLDREPSSSMIVHIQLGQALTEYYRRTSNREHLDHAIGNYQHIVKNATHQEERITALKNMGDLLMMRFHDRAVTSDLDKAIATYTKLLMLLPDFSQEWAIAKHQLGVALLLHFEEENDMVDLAEALRLFHQALEVIDSSSLKATIHLDIAMAYSSGHSISGEKWYLDRAIDHAKHGVSLTAEDDEKWYRLQASLGTALQSRYNIRKDIADLNWGIQIYEDTLAAFIKYGASVELQSPFWFSLGWAMLQRFMVTEYLDDLYAAVDFYRQLLSENMGLEVDMYTKTIFGRLYETFEYWFKHDRHDLRELILVEAENLTSICHDWSSLFALYARAVICVIDQAELEPAYQILDRCADRITVILNQQERDIPNQELTDLVAGFLFTLHGAGDAILDYFLALLLQKLTHSTAICANLLSDIGGFLWQFNHPRALNFMQMAEASARSSCAYEILVDVMTNMGAYYNDILGQQQHGLEISLEAIKAAEKYGCTNNVRAFFNAGNISINLKQYKAADSYLSHAAYLGKQRGDYATVVDALRALSRQQKRRGLLLNAEELLREAVDLARVSGNVRVTVRVLDAFGELLTAKGDYLDALKVFTEAISIAQTKNDLTKIPDLEEDLTLITKILQGEVLAFEMIDPEYGGWSQAAIPTHPDLLTYLGSLPSPPSSLWSIVQTLKLHQELEEQLATLRTAVAASKSAKDITTEVERRVEIIHSIFRFLFVYRQYIFTEKLAPTLNENTVALANLKLGDRNVGSKAHLGFLLGHLIQRALPILVHEQEALASIKNLALNPHQSVESSMKQSENIVEQEEIIQLLIKIFEAVDASNDPQIGHYALEVAVFLPLDWQTSLLNRLFSTPHAQWGEDLYASLAARGTPNVIIPYLETAIQSSDAGNESKRLNYLIQLVSKQVQQGDLAEAELSLHEAIEICQANELVETEPELYFQLGTLQRSRGKYEDAIVSYDKCILLAEELNQRLSLGRAYHHKGNILFDMLNFPKALSCFTIALDIFLERPDYGRLAFIYDNIANVMEAQEQRNKAIWYRRRALEVAVWSNEIDAIALCTWHLGVSLLQRDEFTESKRMLDTALTLYSTMGTQDRWAHVKHDIGSWYLNRANPHYSKKEAVSSYTESAAVAYELSLPRYQALNLMSVSHLLAEVDIKQALEFVDQAVDIYRRIYDLRALIEALRTRALFMLKSEDPMGALSSLKESLEVIDRVVSQYTIDDDHVKFLASENEQICELGAFAAFLLENYSEVFELSERAKSRVLHKQISFNISRRDLSKIPLDLQKKEEHISNRLSELKKRRQFETGQEALHSDDEYQQKREEMEKLWAALEEYATEYVKLRRALLGDIDTVTNLLATLSPPSYLIEFLYFDWLPTGIIMILKPNGKLFMKEIELSGTIVQQCKQTVEQEIVQYGSAIQIEETWHRPLQSIVEVIEREIPSDQPIIIVPHRQMYHVPIHAIPYQGRRLNDRNPITYLPSASMLPLYTERSAAKTQSNGEFLVVGTVFETEAESIARILEAKPLLGEQASKDTICAMLPSSKILHFSCHGIFNDLHPHLSGLKLAKDEVLLIDDILSQQLLASLVILSACQSATTRILPGNELTGLAQAFLIAGARCVIATMWEVEEDSTSQFMQYFYKYWLQNNVTIAEALRLAQQDLRKSDKWCHPYFWSGFIVIGDGSLKIY